MEEELRDPILRHLPPDPPVAYLAMSPAERARRGRLLIVLWCAGYELVHAWFLALRPRRDIDAMWAETGPATDAQIERMVQDRATIEGLAGRRAANA